MLVSKKNITDGLTNFIQLEVIKNIPDNSMKILIGALVFSIKNNPNLIDSYLEQHPMITQLLCNSDDMVDIDALSQCISSSIQEYGNLVIVLPRIPLISRDEKTLSFSSTDIINLKSYIERACQMSGH